MNNILEAKALSQLFTGARTFNAFLDREVPDELIKEIYELMKWTPTSMNCQPGHYLVVKSPESKALLNTALVSGNQQKSLAAPATVIVAYDTQFHNNLPMLFPAYPNAKDMFESNKSFRIDTAFRNSSLQGAYFILAARSLGLDCGPMSGFDNKRVDETFFPDGRYKSNFLINIGYGDATKNYPRGPRLEFSDAVAIL
ncbi:malonic semialdehyde reductase [Saccharophagus degradans]|uniref:Putative NADH dehydrogenase/NAD(P)H nitroreductase Q4521_02090 n=1 Tax=Saccharophagus degradans TaxID=86304 RepID=A0AAW7X3R8_9GAMM|nr:malonic semialdehyde reductase [Saccharophagus degradans]MDO6421256.1 malonic semialdehyde reductase [Saccharophagus degradans]MDO6605833.1 malonic semialdehyde reductase [Saccharophagus degradans]